MQPVANRTSVVTKTKAPWPSRIPTATTGVRLQQLLQKQPLHATQPAIDLRIPTLVTFCRRFVDSQLPSDVETRDNAFDMPCDVASQVCWRKGLSHQKKWRQWQQSQLAVSARKKMMTATHHLVNSWPQTNNPVTEHKQSLVHILLNRKTKHLKQKLINAGKGCKELFVSVLY